MYAISAGHEVTAQAAEMILKEGGNAIDAAIAAFVTSWVAEPCMSSAGGGGFAMAFGRSGRVKLFDFFVQTPQRKKVEEEIDFYPIGVDFGDMVETFHIGKASTAVPGSVAGIFALHRFAGSMPMSELVQPAIHFAKAGVEINAFQYFDFKLLEPILRKGGPRGQELYFPKGKLIAKGQVMKMEQLADFLDFISKEGADGFYKGEIAQKIAKDYEKGGNLSRADFEAYEVLERTPLQLPYRDKVVLTNPGPSLGGAYIAAMLSRLQNEAKLPSSHKSTEYLEFWNRILTAVRTNAPAPEFLVAFAERQMAIKRGNTTHLNVVDKKGNAVSLTSTNGEGNGYFIDGTDIQLNNMLGEAALLPMGFHLWEPNTRLSSMMAPTILTGADKTPEIVLGSGGAGRIASAIAQVIYLLVDQKLPLEQAVDAARVHLEPWLFNIEKGFERTTLDIPQEAKWWNERSLFFGGVHTLQKVNGQWLATGDGRRDGVHLTG